MSTPKPAKLLSLPKTGDLTIGELVSRTWRKFTEHDIATKAAAVAFYSMIAMVPLLAVVLTAFTHLTSHLGEWATRQAAGRSAALDLFSEAIGKLMPVSAYEIVETEIVRLGAETTATIVSVSIIVAIWTASSVFATICKTMDEIYEQPLNRSFWKLRYTAFLITLSQSFVFICSLSAFFIWPIAEAIIAPYNYAALQLALVSQWLLLALVVLASFSMLMHIGPRGKRIHPIFTPGAMFATPVFLLATGLFRLYVIQVGAYNQTYGSLGGVMILLLWFWITGLVLLTGAAIDSVVGEDLGLLPYPQNHSKKSDLISGIGKKVLSRGEKLDGDVDVDVNNGATETRPDIELDEEQESV